MILLERKVLFTASTFSHILNFHLPYLRAFQEHGWTVHVACGGESKSVPYAEKSVVLPFKKQMRAPENFEAARRLRALIETEQYALVVTHTSLASFFTRYALRGLRQRPKLINMVHGYLFDGKTPLLKRELLLTAERLTAPQTDLLLTMNEYDYKLAQKYRLGGRVLHIPGVGVDFSRFDGAIPFSRGSLGIEEDAFVLIYAAEFSARKGQELLLRAMERLPERAVLLLPGDGAKRDACRELAKQLGLEKRVIFPGHVSRMEDWYAMADAAVSVSRSEGLPFNIMEAMYAGLPVAASAVKGHTDLIDHGQNGLLFPYGDIDACAEQIQVLMDSEKLRQRLSQNAKADAEQYRLERVFPLVWEDYMSVVETPAYAGT